MECLCDGGVLFGYVVCMGSIVGFPRLGCGGF